MIDPLQLYYQHLKKLPSFSAAVEKELWARVKKGDNKAKKKIVMAYLKIVPQVANKYRRSGMDLLDLIEEGNIGLMHAVEKFNAKKKVKFSTYATYWIEQAIRRSVDEQKRTIRIPPHIWQKLRRWLKSWEKLQQRYGRNPTVSEMAKKLRMTSREIKQILNIMDVSRNQASFDAPIDDSESIYISDLLSDSTDEAGDFIEYLRVSNQIGKALGVLSERERKLVILRYGLFGNEPHTLEELAKKAKISKERVRQLLERAYRYLRAAVDRMKFK